MILELTSQQAKACALAFFNLAKIKVDLFLIVKWKLYRGNESI